MKQESFIVFFRDLVSYSLSSTPHLKVDYILEYKQSMLNLMKSDIYLNSDSFFLLFL